MDEKIECDMGGCGRVPAWRVRPIEGMPEFVHRQSLQGGTPSCGEHLAEACLFILQLTSTTELVVTRISY